MKEIERDKIKERLKLAGVKWCDDEKLVDAYIAAADELPGDTDISLHEGYKLCKKCDTVKKVYLFNKDNKNKNGCSGSCKECQRASAKASYKRTKKKRKHKEAYQKNKEYRQQHAREYYKKNKEACDIRHKEYLKTKKGKKVMQKARAKRTDLMNNNKGVEYTRDDVFIRDNGICWICGKPVENNSDYHVEHVVPISMGGADCFTNVAVAHAECNLKKTKDAREFDAYELEEVLKGIEARTIKYLENTHPGTKK